MCSVLPQVSVRYCIAVSVAYLAHLGRDLSQPLRGAASGRDGARSVCRVPRQAKAKASASLGGVASWQGRRHGYRTLTSIAAVARSRPGL
jgi:hypothetical protein